MKKKDDDIIEIVSHEARDKKGAVIDLKRRDKQTRRDYWWHFEDPEHLEKVDLVNSIVEKLFADIEAKIYPAVARAPAQVPMSVIKVQTPDYYSIDEETRRVYTDKITDMGVIITHSENTDSFLYHIP